MPNYCNNSLKIKGNKTNLNKFAKKINKKAFLASFIPLPKELDGTNSPTGEKPNLNLLAKYKADNWYDWKVKNYGTKWDCEIDWLEKTEYDIQCSFDSAWSPPIEGLRQISLLYPKLVFFLDYEEEGAGFKGLARIDNGVVDDKCFNY